MADQPVIKNAHVLGDIDVPLLRRTVEFGEDIVVSIEHAAALLVAKGNWVAVNDAAKAVQAKLDADEADAVPALPAHVDTPPIAAPVAPAVIPTVVDAPAVSTPDATKGATA